MDNRRNVVEQALDAPVGGFDDHLVETFVRLGDLAGDVLDDAAGVEIHGAVAIGLVASARRTGLLVLAPDPEAERLAADRRQADAAEHDLLGVVGGVRGERRQREDERCGEHRDESGAPAGSLRHGDFLCES